MNIDERLEIQGTETSGVGAVQHVAEQLDQQIAGDHIPGWAKVAVLVAALGYFVDVVDLWLFSNFRVASLRDLGLSPEQVTTTGAYLLNCQQAGLLLGGLLWGIIGDRRGRASVMFGSILLYSVGNILNAFVVSVPQYAALRFLTGLGLAGEIGAGITLVCELLPRTKRGLGTTLVTGLGVGGAIAASLMGKYMNWRTAFFVGGVMGLMLLFLRAMTHDSSLFAKMQQRSELRRGSLALLVLRRDALLRFLACIAVGAPVWLSVAIFAVFSLEVAPAFGVTEAISVPDCLLCISIGMTVGDVAAGLFSQALKSRKLPLLVLLSLTCITAIAITAGLVHTSRGYMTLVGLLGLFSGYWACLLTTSAEQFGTNIRATAATMVPNLIRATTIPITLGFVTLKQTMSIQDTVWILVVVVFSAAFLGLKALRETFHTDLEYYEQ
jgi:putative MFS transporter